MKPFRELTVAGALCALAFISGCAGSGYGGTTAANPAVSAVGQAAMGSAVNSAVGALGVPGSPMMSSILQNMAQSVIQGQIGQQVAPADQNFRLQQLGGMMQSGTVNQAQQWSNPQTGNTIAVSPVGQAMVDPTTQQQCRDLEEVYTSSSGQTIRERRRACQDASGKWVLVQ